MKLLNRRDFLKFAGISGVVLLTDTIPLNILQSAYAQKSKGINLTGTLTTVDLGNGKPFIAWTYNGKIPGPEIRVKEGERLRVILKNNLPEETTIHWHGLPVPNNMDGVPFITQKPVPTGGTFVYDFEALVPGTYMYHSHAHYQLDRGLYGALIVEPRREERSYDREYVLLLEDWATIDGGGPEASKRGRIQPAMGMMSMMSRGSGGPLQEPLYDAYTINGKVFEASKPFKIKKGDRIRFRIVNPSSSTTYTLRIAGHPLTITHADGRPVLPVTVDALRIGMGERYDIELTANNPGRWHIYNIRDNTSVGGWLLGTLLYYGITSTTYNTDNMARAYRISDYSFLEGIDERYVKPVTSVDKVIRMNLSGGMMSPYWTINGRIYPDSDDISIKQGDRVRLEYFNMSMMAHPMHLHGHFFEVVGTGRVTGVRIKKDTLMIPPHMGRGAVEFIADNPGVWFHHCHNLYHMEAGMANLVKIFSKKQKVDS
jgi:FtsP/CotA-like multicopper oxidase with cupredoxin domain